MKKLITTILLMVLGLTAIAESIEEILKEDEEFQKKLDAEQLEENREMLKDEESFLKMLVYETWDQELKGFYKDDTEVTYSFRAVTLKRGKNRVIVNVVLNTVTVNGRAYKFDKDFEICKSAKKAHELNKVVNK